jgi:hypothetical protein
MNGVYMNLFAECACLPCTMLGSGPAGQAGVVECGIEIDEDKIVIYSFINSRFVCNRPLCLLAEQDSGQDSNSPL